MDNNGFQPWSPVEVMQRAQLAVEARDAAVEELYEIGVTEAEAKRALRIGKAQAMARMKTMTAAKVDGAPTNADERRIWLDAETVDLEHAAELAGVSYWTQREVIRHHADVLELCRTLMVSHRESRVDR